MAITRIESFDCRMPFPLDLRILQADLNARNAIDTNARYLGLLCFTVQEQTLWMLSGGTENENWEQIYPPLVSSTTGAYVNSAAPINSTGSDGDLYFRPGMSDGTHLYRKVNGIWTDLGSISDPSQGIIKNNALTYGQTSAQMNAQYPNVPVGTSVWSETNSVEYRKMDSTKWKITIIEIV